MWTYVKQYLHLAVIAAAFMVGEVLMDLLQPEIMSAVVDDGVLGVNTGGVGDLNLIWTLGIRMICLVLFGGFCGSMNNVFVHLSGQNIGNEMRKDAFRSIMTFSFPQVDRFGTGSLVTRVTNDIENISNTVSSTLPSLFSGVLTIIGTASIMLWYCWQLALLSCATVLLTVLATKFLSKRVRKFSRKRQQLLGQLNGTVEEMISGYRTVVAYNHQDMTTEEFCATSDDLTRAGIRTDIFSGVMGPIMNCIGNIGFVIVAAFGGYFAIYGLISVGVISAFIVYAKQFSRPINEIAQVYGQLQTAIAGAERVFALLDESGEDMNGQALVEDEDATVYFENVNFSYVPGHPVIRDFNLTVPSGKKVALVGSTGSGKTTVVNLLMRYYDIDSGVIRIDEQNIAEVARDSVRKNVAIVLQDTVLFSDTIRNNLLYANETATQTQLDEAVHMSRCEAMLKTLPDGYDTILTAAGANLSQGQRQLLAIARAFVADPKILILDEATSNVDTRTEKAIQSAMQRIMKDRTSIVIAHRLSTIRDADIIVVMDRGRIVEQGNHEALLERGGKYYDLYMTQFAGFAT